MHVLLVLALLAIPTVGVGGEDYLPPSWFMHDIQFCYHWYADGREPRQCDGVANVLCAYPGHRTRNYRDDTDRRDGGCKMSWGLIPSRSTQPAWFGDVKICFRWYADGSASGQCGGGGGTHCAPFGTYTNPYRDDTDRRDGGCRMSWMISVPASAPVWLRDVQMCYYWSADGDRGQCGGGVANTLCAKANTWTQYYRDDTDGRTGGCRMQWWIKVQRYTRSYPPQLPAL